MESPLVDSPTIASALPLPRSALLYRSALGILLMADFPNFGEGGDTPLGRRRFEVMMREAIERDFNHPSIFAWCLFNETWGFGGQVEFVKLFQPKQETEVAEGNPPPAAFTQFR